MKKIILLTLTTLIMMGCDQYVTRQIGGTTTIKLEPNQKIVEATWKDDGNIWYLIEPMDSDYIPKTKVFQESSVLGIMEGKVIFIETKN